MSSWYQGKLEIKCSIDVLRRALIGIKPEWESKIQTDPNGNIPLYNYSGRESPTKCQVVIPGIGNPQGRAEGIRYNDIGFNKNADGTWTVTSERGGINGINSIESAVKAEIQKMKAIAIARLKGGTVTSIEREGNTAVVEIEIPKRVML